MHITSSTRPVTFTTALLAAAAIAACGGGGSDTAPTAAPPGAAAPDPTPVTLSGVAATGAPLAGATVTVTDSTGAVVGTPAVAAADGSYSYLVPKEAVAPFVVAAVRDDVALYTPVATRGTATVNITPITNLAAVTLSPTGNAAALAAQIAAGQATLTADGVAAAVGRLTAALKPLLDNVGDSTNPISGTFKADGTGHDRVLNALSVAVNSTGSGANISVTVKAAVADGEQPPSINFTNSGVPPALPASVATASLPAADTDALLADLTARLTRCYGLPLAQRVSGTGSTATVAADECNGVFKGGSAANYLNNGGTVGPSGAFSGIFNAGSTGVVFDRSALLGASAGGSMVVSYRTVSASGGTGAGKLVVQREGGKLVVAGNQYRYSASINPWAEDRETVNSPDTNNINTGYSVTIANAVSNGVPVFDRAVVTSPRGTALTFRPRAGLNYLALQRPDGTLTNTSVIRLAGRFNAATTPGVPRDREAGIYWAPNPAGAAVDWTDAELVSLNSVGTWKIELFNANNTGASADTVQYLKTFSRAYALAELAQQKWAQPTAAARALLVAQSSAAGAIALQPGSAIDVSVDGADAWMVPAGATVPTQLAASGPQSATNASRWNDTVALPASARKATVACAAQSASDLHCAGGGYAQGVLMNQLQLTATDTGDIVRAKSLNLYRIP